MRNRSIVSILLLFLFGYTFAYPTLPTMCKATVSVESTYPASQFYIYNNIMITNVGTCDIVGVLVNVSLPPNAPPPFAYQNYSTETGELTGKLEAFGCEMSACKPEGSVY